MPVFLVDLSRLVVEPKRYPHQLARGANNAAITLSETEISGGEIDLKPKIAFHRDTKQMRQKPNAAAVAQEAAAACYLSIAR